MVRVAHTSKPHLGRVLVVDDDAAMRRGCARTLGGEGWDVVVVEGGKAALAHVADHTAVFDCVVSDVHMPEMDGFALIAEIHRHDDDLPVLLMTGDPSLDGAVRATHNGAVSYLSKPFAHEPLGAPAAGAARRHGVARMRRRAASSSDTEINDSAERFDSALAKSWMAFQPIVDIATNRTFAYEALVRTDEESLKRTAVARAAPHIPGDVLIFVNLHALELTDDDLFSDRCALAPFASRVVLEITERIGLDPVAGPARVAMLRQCGYRIAVDHLG